MICYVKMGVKNFNKVVKSNAAKSVKKISLKKLIDSNIGLDCSLITYQSYYGIVGTSGKLLRDDGEDVTALYGLAQKLRYLESFGCRLIMVMDGKPPAIKSETLCARKDLNEASKNPFCLTKSLCEQIVKLCTLMGITVMRAKGEADALLGRLSKDRKIDYVLSDDADMICFGGMKMLRKVKRGEAELFDANLFMKEMDYDLSKVIDLCCMLGNDYNPNPKGIGPKRAVSILSTQSIKEFMESKGLDEEYKKMVVSKTYYETAPSLENYRSIKSTKKNSKELAVFLSEEVGMSESKIKKFL